MSKGSQVVPVRLPADLLSLLDQEVDKQNRNRVDEPYARSSWIRAALWERLNHLARARKKKTS